MKIELAKLRPNPWRPIEIDPIDDVAADRIVASINETGFWGGSPIRPSKEHPGEYEIAAGATRIYAAIKAGEQYADLPVKNRDDVEMIRTYVIENVTQRGTHVATAMVGGIAAAIKFIAYGILTEDEKLASTIVEAGGNGRNQPLEALMKEGQKGGIGEAVLIKFFKGIEGMNARLIRDALANLKESGIYAGIIKGVADQLKAEAAAKAADLEQLKAEEEAKAKAAEEAKQKADEAKAKAETGAPSDAEAHEAKKAATAARREHHKASAAVKEVEKKAEAAAKAQKAERAAAAKPITFDFAGVSKYLKNASHVRTFRKIVTAWATKQKLPVDVQADLAARVLQQANQNNDGELTADFILKHLGAILRAGGNFKLSEKALKEIEREDLQTRFNLLSHHFCRNIVGANKDALAMCSMKDNNPELQFSVTWELRNAVSVAAPQMKQLAEKFNL